MKRGIKGVVPSVTQAGGKRMIATSVAVITCSILVWIAIGDIGIIATIFGIVLGLVSVTGMVLGGLIYLTGPVAEVTPRCPSRSIRAAVCLLPAQVKDRYLEEWAGWMLDLRVDGTPRLRRWSELLKIVLIAAPKIAIARRFGAGRAVD
ncbi:MULTISPECIES: hypothetical protein [Actinosynnema]|uniref:hypothetical protein n=1 Tax=Actinosynnema TaxID=40566 RepID=UPI0020A5A7E4|nr:hypothetical protein [Actinosynnema pretiosum]MCP2097292.1 hypothetical protein [Actinosynnema pretiosum]